MVSINSYNKRRNGKMERSSSEVVEIAYAAATDKLCFFTGTGFSKAVTKGKAQHGKIF